MKRRLAMSAMGYGIVLVIILGIIMIVSAPMLVNNTKKENIQSTDGNIDESNANNSRVSSGDYDAELQNLEQRLTTRIENLENRQNSQQSSSSSSSTNKFVCTMEGALDASGEVIPLETPNRSDKIVFVCEYR